jgi:hypothetical protein
MTEAPTQPAIDPYAVLFDACRRTKLKPRETTLMRDCLFARRTVENGHLLITPRRVAAARRLMEKGYLLQAPDQPRPFDPVNFGLVVVARTEHFDKLIADANVAGAD